MQPPGSTPGTAGAAGADSAPKMDHAAFLRLYCRLCGLRKIHANQFLHPIQNYKSLISMLHEIDVSTESDQLFPKSACSDCHVKYRASKDPASLFAQAEKAHTANDPDALTRLTRANNIVDFWAHSSVDCQICDDPNYSRDGAEEQFRAVKAKRLYQTVQAAGGGSGGAAGVAGSGAQRRVNGAPGAAGQQGVFGKNRKYKANVQANILGVLQTEGPEVLRNLKNFGITYVKPTDARPTSAFVEADTKR